MARRPRIDMQGFYHIVNRGVEQRVVFLDDGDFQKFLAMLDGACLKFDVRLHAYCLMSNHYHLLVETLNDDLSKFMRHINASYAIYFNKKNNRVGHLWQGRFKSWYVSDERYLYTLLKYIEYNPLEAGMSQELGEYEYSSYRALVGREKPIECLKNSLVLKEYPQSEDAVLFFTYMYDPLAMDELSEASSLVASALEKKILNNDVMRKDFGNVKNKTERNELICQFYKDGFSQHAISTVVGISQPAIHKIVGEKL